MSTVQELHEKMSQMTLREVMLLAAQAIEAGLDDKRINIILQYVEMKIRVRKMTSP